MIGLGIKLVKVYFWFLALGTFLLCVGMLVIQIPNSVTMLKALSRPTVPGIVTALDFAEHRSPMTSPSSRPKKKEYDLYIEFVYDVGGRTHTGSVVRASGDEPYRMRELKEKLDAYRVGTTVDVHYVPHDPAQAALEVGVDGVTIIALVMCFLGAIIFLGATVLPIVVWWVTRHDGQLD